MVAAMKYSPAVAQVMRSKIWRVKILRLKKNLGDESAAGNVYGLDEGDEADEKVQQYVRRTS
jgi:hypothetical protein